MLLTGALAVFLVLANPNAGFEHGSGAAWLVCTVALARDRAKAVEEDAGASAATGATTPR